MDILSLGVRLNSPQRTDLYKAGALKAAPQAGLAAGAANPSIKAAGASSADATAEATPKEDSPEVKRMLDKARQAQEAMEAAKVKEKELAKERREDIKKRLDQIIKKIRIIKELYANNPEKMASNLSAIFKELKTALKDYRNAGGTLTQMIGDSEGRGQVDTSEKPLTKVEAQEWETAAREAKAFMGTVGAIAKKVKELLEESRLKAKMMEPDEDRDKAFEEADKSFKELAEFMEDMDKDIREALEQMQVQGDEAVPGMDTAMNSDVAGADAAADPALTMDMPIHMPVNMDMAPAQLIDMYA